MLCLLVVCVKDSKTKNCFYFKFLLFGMIKKIFCFTFLFIYALRIHGKRHKLFLWFFFVNTWDLAQCLFVCVLHFESLYDRLKHVFPWHRHKAHIFVFQKHTTKLFLFNVWCQQNYFFLFSVCFWKTNMCALCLCQGKTCFNLSYKLSKQSTQTSKHCAKSQVFTKKNHKNNLWRLPWILNA